MTTSRPLTRARTALLLAACLLMAGCTTSGLSVRETPMRDYTGHVMALHQVTGGQRTAERPQVPLTIACGQMGENAPAGEFLDVLRSRPDLFTRVETVPVSVPPAHGRHDDDGGDWQDRIDRLRTMATGMGCEWLFLYGGTVDAQEVRNGLALADIALVPALVMPSREYHTEGRITGVLIHVESGRVGLSAAADVDTAGSYPPFFRGTGQAAINKTARDDLNRALGEQLVERLATGR